MCVIHSTIADYVTAQLSACQGDAMVSRFPHPPYQSVTPPPLSLSPPLRLPLSLSLSLMLPYMLLS